jgi:hypothetical protein
LNACLLDERVVASETTTLEWIASTIVHEATHARLEKWGIAQDKWIIDGLGSQTSIPARIPT